MTKIVTFLCFFLSLFSVGLNAKQLPDIEIPSFMEVSPVRGGINLGGLNVKTYVFQSLKGNDEILAFYNDLWSDKVKSSITNQWIFHSYYDGTFLYSIQVRRKGEGGSFFKKAKYFKGIIAVSEPDFRNKKADKIKIETIYPLSPGTKILTDLSSTDLGKKSRTTVMNSPGGILDNLNHYKRHFESKDWKEVLDRLSLGMARELGGTSLIMQKGTDELVLSFIPGKKGTKIISVLVTK